MKGILILFSYLLRYFEKISDEDDFHGNRYLCFYAFSIAQCTFSGPLFPPLTHSSVPFSRICLTSFDPSHMSLCFLSHPMSPVLRLCSLSPVLCPLSHVSFPCIQSAVPSLTWSDPCLPSRLSCKKTTSVSACYSRIYRRRQANMILSIITAPRRILAHWIFLYILIFISYSFPPPPPQSWSGNSGRPSPRCPCRGCPSPPWSSPPGRR